MNHHALTRLWPVALLLAAGAPLDAALSAGFVLEPFLGGRVFEDWGQGAGVLWGTVVVWVPLFDRSSVDGLMEIDPIPAGRTPLSWGPPSTDRLIVPLNVLDPLPVLKFMVPLPVAPVLEIGMTIPPLELEKSRETPPMLIATG